MYFQNDTIRESEINVWKGTEISSKQLLKPEEIWAWLLYLYKPPCWIRHWLNGVNKQWTESAQAVTLLQFPFVKEVVDISHFTFLSVSIDTDFSIITMKFPWNGNRVVITAYNIVKSNYVVPRIFPLVLSDSPLSAV